MTPEQVAVNHTALVNLAARLEHMGYAGDAHAEAEHIALNLLADGYRVLEKPTPLTGPGSTDEHRAAALAHIRAVLADARRRHETHAQTEESTR